MSTRFRDPVTLVHNAMRESGTRRGTTRYASINNQMGKTLSRRDDLESICYILIRFLRGSLPWENLPVDPAQEKSHRKVREIKINMPISTLCSGIPEEFAQLLHYARSLKFDEAPNLDYWKEKFHALYVRHGYDQEVIYLHYNERRSICLVFCVLLLLLLCVWHHFLLF
jgi:hypothetical protein